MKIFNIHGLEVQVEGVEMERWWQTEYGLLEVNAPGLENKMLIVPSDRTDLPIKPKGMRAGFDILHDGTTIVLEYESGVNPQFIMTWAEARFSWPDKLMAHAGGVTVQDKAILLLAGPNTGKTTSVLRYVAKGAGYLADDWVVIGAEGKAYALPKTIHVYDYNFANDPALCSKFYNFPRLVAKWMRTRDVIKNSILPSLPSRALRYAGEIRLSQVVRYADITDLHPDAKVASPSPIAKAIWMQRGPYDRLTMENTTPEDLAERIIKTKIHENSRYFGTYAMRSALDAEDYDPIANLLREKAIAASSLQGVPCHLLKIPIHASPDELMLELDRIVEGTD